MPEASNARKKINKSKFWQPISTIRHNNLPTIKSLNITLNLEELYHNRLRSEVKNHIKDINLDVFHVEILCILDYNNKTQMIEIGNIAWMTYQEAIQNIRPYNIEKINMLKQTYNIIKYKGLDKR